MTYQAGAACLSVMGGGAPSRKFDYTFSESEAL